MALVPLHLSRAWSTVGTTRPIARGISQYHTHCGRFCVYRSASGWLVGGKGRWERWVRSNGVEGPFPMRKTALEMLEMALRADDLLDAAHPA